MLYLKLTSPSKNASSLQIAKLCEYIFKNGEVKLILLGTGFKKIFLSFMELNSDIQLKKLDFLKKFPTGFIIICILCGYN